jgi:hypothetical protein
LRQEVKPYKNPHTVISPGAVATELPNSVIDPDTGARIRKFYDAWSLWRRRSSTAAETTKLRSPWEDGLPRPHQAEWLGAPAGKVELAVYFREGRGRH